MEHCKKLLLIQVKGKKAAQIKALCDRLQIQVIAVDARDFGKPLGSLAGIKGFGGSAAPGTKIPQPTAKPASKPGLPLAPAPIPPAEMMVFCGINPDALDAFLAAYKEAGIESIGLKAVITPTNIRWDVATLYRELLREQMQLH